MIKKLIVVTAALLVFATAFFLKDAERESTDPADEQRLLQSEQTSLPRLVDLGSDKCIPCKKMAPILDELSQEYHGSLVVEVIDIKKNPDAGKPWEIRLIPTQIFIDSSGRERFRHEGFMAKEAILDKWKELGVKLTPNPQAAGTG